MKLDRRTVLSGTAAAFAAPLFTALPARPHHQRQSPLGSSLDSARTVLGGQDLPDDSRRVGNGSGVTRLPEVFAGGHVDCGRGGPGMPVV